MQQRQGLPAGRPVVWDDRVRLWADASVVLGGAPWGVLRIAATGRPFLRRLRGAGPRGLAASPGVEQTLADLLLARGIVHPVAVTVPIETATAVEVVVPAYQRPELLEACLISLRQTAPGSRVIVVDDASESPRVAEVARAHGATVLRHEVNRGPAAARNTGLREANSPIVAFIDADCVATDGWLTTVVPHFDDSRVAAVAPRITAHTGSQSLLARYEAVRSALDMGPRPELVTHGAPLGFLPSAALAIRRSALSDSPFDEQLRVGEDVDLIWRLVDAGAMVRYEPAAVVTHEMRATPQGWAKQLFGYGTSAAELDRRHPGRLAPARLSFWNVAAAALLFSPRRAAGRAAAAGAVAVAAALLARTLRSASVDPRAAAVIVGKGLLADATATGHLLRREWWPIGWLALATARRSGAARAAAAAMLLPPVGEWLTRRPQLNPPGYLALRMIADAAYGSGVIVSAIRSRRPGVLVPRVRPPQFRRPRG
ncbi:MAG TPA: mycofactocin biosynthesis glycosyltransferase MftF [Mycobacterium sp.]|uniref:mycofactocin biosynthesis glycosyltransferase MftF n=1 Tax=Mycolicibacterium sp. TaxID=2320850 RepID=UPI0025E4E3C4|nr:mycofactocin biosynthesis glycosyltransferase MftF [Mycolicibacterium sp.]HPX38427.1 mycofactocin biosynthesis glycosyltransferase MftF [Mycobacterium sp.]HQC78562.1 mycofactocin biosynthesis glycosyltransferase MftF [Mycobacterium sp.]